MIEHEGTIQMQMSGDGDDGLMRILPQGRVLP